jgi:hypothetical protein
LYPRKERILRVGWNAEQKEGVVEYEPVIFFTVFLKCDV